MKPNLLLCLALVLSGGLLGCSTVHRQPSAISPVAQRIVQEMLDSENLSSFEGTNTIICQAPTFTTTTTKQFTFLRPNRFVILPDSTNDSQLFCDGTNFYDYRPYYFNSYTKAPAPARYEDAITNFIGGQLLYLIVSTNRLHYVMTGFGRGMVALSYEGEETVDGVTCHHLLILERGSGTTEFWIAAGDPHVILKCVLRDASTVPVTKGIWTNTETISGWRANVSIPAEQFAFAPPAGAIEHPSEADQIEMSIDLRTGETKARFYSTNESKIDSGQIQSLALEGILKEFPALKVKDLVFTGIRDFGVGTSEEKFVATYELPKTAETSVM
jgi:hypothetical protein